MAWNDPSPRTRATSRPSGGGAWGYGDNACDTPDGFIVAEAAVDLVEVAADVMADL